MEDEGEGQEDHEGYTKKIPVVIIKITAHKSTLVLFQIEFPPRMAALLFFFPQGRQYEGTKSWIQPTVSRETRFVVTLLLATLILLTLSLLLVGGWLIACIHPYSCASFVCCKPHLFLWSKLHEYTPPSWMRDFYKRANSTSQHLCEALLVASVLSLSYDPKQTNSVRTNSQ